MLRRYTYSDWIGTEMKDLFPLWVSLIAHVVLIVIFWSVYCSKVRSALRSKPTLPWPTNQPWRQPVGIRFIETLKEGLVEKEKYLTLGQA